MTLNRIDHGGGEHPPLLIAHGLFGSARNWGAIAKRLSADRQVAAVDMRNHGTSPWFNSHSYQDLAQDLGAELRPGSDLLGHSMGGKAAMVLALSRPEMIRKLVIADIAPVAYGHTQAHLIDAMEAVDLSAVTQRRDADAQLQQIVPDPTVRAFLLQSLDVAGQRWRLNLPVLRTEMDGTIGFPEIDGSFTGPTLFLSGGDSDYVRPEHRERIKDLFPKARFAKLPGAGHWLHAEKPKDFVAAVDTFLKA